MTAKGIIEKFLLLKIGQTIPNHVIETDVPKFGKDVYNILHSPGTYSRAWRDLRAKGSKQFTIIESVVENSTEKHFRIRRKDEICGDSRGINQEQKQDNSSKPVENSSGIREGIVP